MRYLGHRSAHGDKGWLDSLEGGLDRRLTALKDLMDERDQQYRELRVTDKEARALARADIDRRLEGMNEMRAQIERERGSYLERSEYEVKHEALGKEVAVLRDDQNRVVGAIRDDLAALRTAVAVGPAGLPELRSRVDYSGGEKQGRAAVSARLIASVAAMAGWGTVLASILTHGFSH